MTVPGCLRLIRYAAIVVSLMMLSAFHLIWGAVFTLALMTIAWPARRQRMGETTVMSGKCQARVPGCSCDGSCGNASTTHSNGGNGGTSPSYGGAVTACQCTTCATVVIPGGVTSATGGHLVQRRARRKPSGPRAGRAGIEGFDGKSEFEFAVGSVRGLRQWDYQVSEPLHRALSAGATPDGSLLRLPDGKPALLKGAYGGYWQPGLNEATCGHDAAHRPPVEVDPRTGAECGCGFWAYWKVDARSWNHALPVMGVIEGTGRVLIGELGFRCQKGRILGLAPAFIVEPRYYQPVFQYGSGGEVKEPPPDKEREMAEAQTLATAWMGVIMDELGKLYPEARVFATVKGMLATYPTGEVLPS